MKRDKRATLIKLLVLGVIVVSTIGAIPYVRHLKSAKATEAINIMGGLIKHCKTYHRAHKSWPKNSCNTYNKDRKEWIDTKVGRNNVYFNYAYDKDKLKVWAQGKKKPFTKNDTLTYHLKTNRWSATGRLIDVKP